jgi:oxalate decarboxylase/phosphoglucose isomerase-like protein (cupin superfamily)
MNIADKHADDAINIAPDFHKVIFEDDKVRVLKVTVPVGASAAMHWHPQNSNYVVGGGLLRFERPDGSVSDVELSVGQVTSAPEGLHAVQNIGTTGVQTIQTELK